MILYTIDNGAAAPAAFYLFDAQQGKRMNSTIYVLQHGDDPLRLIDAANPAAAIQHAARPQYVATPVKARQLAELMAKGIVIEQTVTVTHT